MVQKFGICFTKMPLRFAPMGMAKICGKDQILALAASLRSSPHMAIAEKWSFSFLRIWNGVFEAS